MTKEIKKLDMHCEGDNLSSEKSLGEAYEKINVIIDWINEHDRPKGDVME